MSTEKNNVPEEILEETAEQIVEETVEETAEQIVEETVEEAEEAEEVNADIEELEKIEQKPKTVEKKKETQTEQQKKVSYILITGIIILAIIMAFATFYAGKEYKAKKEAEAAAEQLKSTCHHINAYSYPSWSVHIRRGNTALEYYYLNEAGKEVKLSADDVTMLIKEQVAFVGDQALDNTMLQYYYNEVLYEMSMDYSNYLMYMVDSSKPYDVQLNETYGDGSETWQKYFIDLALQRYQMTMALLLDAQANGFVMPEEDQRAYDEEMTNLEMMAMGYGYPDGDTFVKEAMGPTASLETYRQYMYDMAVARAYTQKLTEQMDISDEKIEAYYTANEEALAAQYVTKDDTKMVNVRHILIRPETSEDGTISDAAWAVAEKEANRILNEWKAGEATEESFGELAMTYTTDGGSMQTGGLYEEVAPGQMVQPFNDWCFDEARQSGDTGIVKYHMEGHYSGYHVMYYVSQCDQAYWQKVCGEAVLAEEVQKVKDELTKKYEMTVEYGKIIIIDASVPTTPEQEAVITTEPAVQ